MHTTVCMVRVQSVDMVFTTRVLSLRVVLRNYQVSNTVLSYCKASLSQGGLNCQVSNTVLSYCQASLSQGGPNCQVSLKSGK